MANIGFKEDLLNEFISDKNYLKDSEIIDAVVAFANTNGGNLYIGVEDDGTITGLHKEHQDITRLAAFIANKTVPSISVRIEYFDLEEPYLKIVVPKSNVVISSASGKIQRRRIKIDGTPENIPMYPYEIQSRLSSLSLLDFTSLPVLEADYSSLSSVERNRVRNIIHAYRGDASLLELSDEEFDKALHFVTTQNDKLVPTYCGIIMIGEEEAINKYLPTMESTIQILVGTNIKINKSYRLPLLKTVEEIMNIFDAYNNEEEIEIGLFRMSIPLFDKRAFREALINAFCHRDYTMLGRILIQINDEGMIINNPGGFVEGITTNNLIEAEPHGRNPLLADVLKRVGLAERTGRGIDRIYEGSLLYGKKLPSYIDSTSSSVKLFIPKSEINFEFTRFISNEIKKINRPLSIYSLFILYTLKDYSRLTSSELAQKLNMNELRIQISLEQLIKLKIVDYHEYNNIKYYHLNPKLYNNNLKQLNCIRDNSLDYEKMIMNFANKKGVVTRKDVEQLLDLNSSQSYRLLNKLAKKGKLKLEGSGAGSKYFIIK